MTGTDSPDADLLYAVRDGVGYVTFNRPAARNALTFAMYDRLAEIAATAGEDPSLRAILITGAGDRAFAAGTDVAQFRAFASAEDVIAYEERIERVLGTLERCPVPTIAAISGACTGGGASVAACCDLRIATQASRFGYPVARTLGNCLSISVYARLAALIGPAHVKDLVFTARLVEGPEAKAIGLVTELVEDHAALAPRAEALARQVAGHAPLTLRATKEALRRLRPQPSREDGRDLLLACYLSEDFREGVEAFLAKRPPQWRGR